MGPCRSDLGLLHNLPFLPWEKDLLFGINNMSQLNLIPENKQLSATRQALCYALGIWQHTNQRGSCPGECTVQKKECRD